MILDAAFAGREIPPEPPRRRRREPRRAPADVEVALPGLEAGRVD
jgi:hypothetical protein